MYTYPITLYITNSIKSIPFYEKFTNFFCQCLYGCYIPHEKNGTDIFLHRYRLGFMLPQLFIFLMSVCFSFSGSHSIARIPAFSLKCFPFAIFASQSLIVLWTHPLHFISCQLVMLSFHRSSLAFIETQLGGALYFHWTRPFTIITIYIFFYISFRSYLIFLQLTPLKIIYIGIAAALNKPVGFFLYLTLSFCICV